MNSIIPFIEDKEYSIGDDIVLQYPHKRPYNSFKIKGTFYKKMINSNTNVEYYIILINFKNQYIYIARRDHQILTEDELKSFDMEISTINKIMNLKKRIK